MDAKVASRSRKVHLQLQAMLGAANALACARIPHPSLRSQATTYCINSDKAFRGLDGVTHAHIDAFSPAQKSLLAADIAALLAKLMEQVDRFARAAAAGVGGGGGREDLLALLGNDLPVQLHGASCVAASVDLHPAAAHTAHPAVVAPSHHTQPSVARHGPSARA